MGRFGRRRMERPDRRNSSAITALRLPTIGHRHDLPLREASVTVMGQGSCRCAATHNGFYRERFRAVLCAPVGAGVNSLHARPTAIEVLRKLNVRIIENSGVLRQKRDFMDARRSHDDLIRGSRWNEPGNWVEATAISEVRGKQFKICGASAEETHCRTGRSSWTRPYSASFATSRCNRLGSETHQIHMWVSIRITANFPSRSQ
jgi:hypothetical protein